MKIPLVVAVGRSAATEAIADAVRSGFTVLSGWEPAGEPWDLSAARVVFTGRVRDTAAAAAAVLVAVRGGGVIAVDVEPTILPTFAEDLRRVGPVEYRLGTARDSRGLDSEQQQLLTLLAGGSTVSQAARTLHLSRRTATRRLAAARATLGVATTAEALIVTRRHASPEPDGNRRPTTDGGGADRVERAEVNSPPDPRPEP